MADEPEILNPQKSAEFLRVPLLTVQRQAKAGAASTPQKTREPTRKDRGRSVAVGTRIRSSETVLS